MWRNRASETPEVRVGPAQEEVVYNTQSVTRQLTTPDGPGMDKPFPFAEGDEGVLLCGRGVVDPDMTDPDPGPDAEHRRTKKSRFAHYTLELDPPRATVGG